jgi:tetratricopeptide (TPR) repeat protein
MPEKNVQKSLQELIDEADDIFRDEQRRKESKTLFEKALKIAKEAQKELETEYIQGKIDLLDKNWEDALEHFDIAIRLKTDFFKAWHYKGFALHELGKYEEAIACYDKVLEINPIFEVAWSNKGNELLSLGRYEEALMCFEEALKINPTFTAALNNKGNVLRNLGRYEKAIECYNKVLEINPVFEIAWNNKGIALSNLGLYEEAIECYNKAIEINPNYEKAWNNKGNALRSLGRYEKAIECYDRALEINPGYDLARSNRNSVLMFRGRVTEALEEMNKLSSEKKELIEKSTLPKEEKEERLLEIDAQDAVINELKDKYKALLDKKKAYEKRLAESLKPRAEPLKGNFFLVLRRWNSYTPRMLTPTESNLGGGYFLHWKGKGIVIDPGFDFLDNFFNNGLLIYDIDAVIITHAHVDHCSDFESLLALIFEYNEKNAQKKKIDVFMNLGAMKKFIGWIPIYEAEEDAKINRIYPLEVGITYDLGDYIRIRATKAIHDEVLCKAYSVGLIFELSGENGYTKSDPFKIGYTSDTRHDKVVEEQYEGVDIIVPHLGSIDENDFKIGDDMVKRDENHLMLAGVISTIYKSKAKLAIISEFGEELGEERVTIVGALNGVFRRYGMARCLTGDVGLKVKIPDLTIKCHYCKGYFDAKDMFESIDPENKNKKCIVYYCEMCESTYKYEDKKVSKSSNF